MAGRVLAIGAHPDDIEFMMAGTLILLGRAGFELHYMHLSSGSCGSAVLPASEVVPIRREEAKNAANTLGAEYHESIADDIEIFYCDSLLRKLAAVIRAAEPSCLLLPSTVDYMDDHQITARLGATAAFCRGMRNYRTEPDIAPIDNEVAIYHAMPYGLTGPLGEQIEPDFLIDISGLETERKELLELHKSQKDWLDTSQGVGLYVDAMYSMSIDLAKRYDRAGHVEGWRRRLHLGYCDSEFSPLEAALGSRLAFL